MEVMYPSSAELGLVLFRVIPAIVFLAALYFIIRKAVRDAFRDVKNKPLPRPSKLVSRHQHEHSPLRWRTNTATPRLAAPQTLLCTRHHPSSR